MQDKPKNSRYPQFEIDLQIDKIKPDEGAISLPNIFDLIQKAYEHTKTSDMLNDGSGKNMTLYGPNSRTSSLGRGGDAAEDEPSSILSADKIKVAPEPLDEEDEMESNALINKLKGMIHGG